MIELIETVLTTPGFWAGAGMAGAWLLWQE